MRAKLLTVFGLVGVAISVGARVLVAQGPALSVGRLPDRALPTVAQQTARITLDLADVTLGDALKAIEGAGKVRLVYSKHLVPLERRVSLKVANATVLDALRMVLRETDVEPRPAATGQIILQRRATRGPARQDSASGIWGRITSASDGQRLARAIVEIKGIGLTAVANDSGYYTMFVPPGDYTVAVRLIGYRPGEFHVTIPDSVIRMDLALEVAAIRLDELVTTATGPQRRVELGNAITTIRVDSVLETASIKDLTDLLETRVPGLTVQATSGAPGDPGRLRLRGVHSVLRGNDPIIIVDGVRIYSNQSDPRSANLASPEGAQVAAPSPLDHIDPASVETIEVFNGPSAATLYGADAANGVIVITTKRGRPGPARWTASFSRGRSIQPGRYPDAYFRWGHNPIGGRPWLCQLPEPTCVQDSLVRFQALNEPALSVYGVGKRSNVSLGVSGGSATLQYSVSGHYGDEAGLLRLPQLEVDRFRREQGQEPPDWMRRPHHLASWGATGRVTGRLTESMTLGFTTQLARQDQRRSSLEGQVGRLSGTYADLVNGVFIPGPHYLDGYFERTTASSVNLSNGLSFGWAPEPWLSVAAAAGLNVISRADEQLMPIEMRDGAGAVSVPRRMSRGTGRSVMSTLGAHTTLRLPLTREARLTTTIGADYTATSTSDLMSQGIGLVGGTNSLNGAEEVTASESQMSTASFGWFLQPELAYKQRLFLSTGIRFDGGTTYGSRTNLVAFPKVSVSWVLSDEPFFPLKGLVGSLRLRAAYGQAGVQPGATDRLRLYTKARRWLDGTFGEDVRLSTLGNTELRPERSTEIEGGMDVDLFDNFVSVSLTGYRTTRQDALMGLPLPPSVHGGATILKNVGVIRNSGVELSLGLTPVRSSAVVWSTHVNLSRNRNTVVELGRGVEPFTIGSGDWVKPGYPIFGRWVKPILGYSDRDADGIIRANEVQLGDTLAYMGDALPNYNTSIHTNVTLFGGALSVGTSFNYQDDLTQVNQVVKQNAALSRALNDPTAPFGEQAAVAVMNDTDYGLIQTVSTFRFSSLSVSYRVPSSIARALGADDLSIAVQGTNLALYSNYTGKDPHVNASPTGNSYVDQGGLPQPRDWSVRVDVRY